MNHFEGFQAGCAYRLSTQVINGSVPGSRLKVYYWGEGEPTSNEGWEDVRIMSSEACALNHYGRFARRIE